MSEWISLLYKFDLYYYFRQFLIVRDMDFPCCVGCGIFFSCCMISCREFSLSNVRVAGDSSVAARKAAGREWSVNRRDISLHTSV